MTKAGPIVVLKVEIHDSTGREASRPGAFMVRPDEAERAGLVVGVTPHMHLVLRGRSPLAVAVFEPDAAERAAALSIAAIPGVFADGRVTSGGLPLVEVDGTRWHCASAEADAARVVLRRELGPRWRWPCEIVKGLAAD